MGRSLPLGAAVVLLTAPGIDSAELLEPVMGKPLLDACTVVTGTARRGRHAGQDGVAAGARCWIRSPADLRARVTRSRSIRRS